MKLRMWLTLYKQYIDFKIKIDIMDDPPMDIIKEKKDKIPYRCFLETKDIVGFYRPYFNMMDKINCIQQLEPYTFSINDFFSSDSKIHIKEFESFHEFANKYWPNQAIFEVQYDDINDMQWKLLLRLMQNNE